MSLHTTDPLGDTIGGIMAPFIGLLGAILTFMAFWIQYQANQAQLKIIKQQRIKDTIDSIEKPYYFLINHYYNLVEQLEHSELKGKASFGIALIELKSIIEMVAEVVKVNYGLNEENARLKMNYQYGIIAVGTFLWYKGYEQNIKREVLMNTILGDFSAFAETDRPKENKYLQNLSEHKHLFPEFENYLVGSIGKQRTVLGVSITNYGVEKSSKYSAYYKAISNLLIYINNVNPIDFNFEKKRNAINFFIDLMSNEEKELLVFMGLSPYPYLFELEMKYKYNLMTVAYKDDPEKINQLLFSKYKILDSYVVLTDNKAWKLRDIYTNHTRGSRKETQFNSSIYNAIWSKN